MTRKKKDPMQTVNIGGLSNPLDGWPNDDLLLSAKSRDFVRKTQPDLLPILDWPELRDEFEKHETPSIKAKATNRRTGLLSIVSSVIGLIMASIIPLFQADLHGPLRMISEFLLIFGVLFGVWHLWRAKYRSVWLVHRYWTERLRQFYFQFLINNLSLAARAMKNDDARQSYHELRGSELERLLHRKGDTIYIIQNLVSDIANTEPWVFEKWEIQHEELQSSDELEILLNVLERQRLGIQEEYTKKKIQPGYRSPVSRSRFVDLVADVSTFLVVIIGMVIGMLILVFNYQLDSPIVVLFICGSAVLSILILSLRVIDDALCLRVGAHRYQWYLAAVQSINSRYKRAANANEKIRLLREMEHFSYQEMRRFITEHNAARFVL